jgi:GTP cyclohydrolase I
MTFCPCSKELSLVDRQRGIGLGAHNQRAEITVQIEQEMQKKIWLEDLIPVVETCGSCPVYPLLKRPDEKYVTEEGYTHPKFVEDVVRDTATVLQNLPIKWFRVKVLSYESIHPSECSAYISRVKKSGKWRTSHVSFF